MELPKHQWRAWENQKCLGKMTCCFCRPSGLLLNFLTVIIHGENDFKLLKKIVRGKEKKIMFFIACAIDWLVKFWVSNEMIPRKHQGKRVNALYGDSWSLSYPNLLLAEKDFKGIQQLAPRKLGQARWSQENIKVREWIPYMGTHDHSLILIFSWLRRILKVFNIWPPENWGKQGHSLFTNLSLSP